MAQLLHGSATTTARTRADIRASAEPAATLARRYGVNRKTVLKWRRREGVADAPMGPRERRSTVLSDVEEAAVVAFRVQTRLALDDVVAALRPAIPALTRSSAHRALRRQGVSRLPRAARPRRGQFASYAIGYFHLDIAELRTARERAYLFIAVDRTSKFAFARVYRRATGVVAVAFLKVLAKAVPYRLHTVLTDNGIQFAETGRHRVGTRQHPFDRRPAAARAAGSASSTGRRSPTTRGLTARRSAWSARSRRPPSARSTTRASASCGGTWPTTSRRTTMPST